MLQGRLPWLFVDVALGNVPYWAWYVRTQELPWFSEHPLETARYTLYATNGYSVRHPGQPGAKLAELQCVPKGRTVVADLSALITLHRLGLL